MLSSSFGPPAPATLVSEEARNEALAILDSDPPRLVREAALSILAAHTARTSPPTAAVLECVKYLMAQIAQNRYGK